MKKFYSVIAGILITASVFAQAPEKMSYQAVVRDLDQRILINEVVGMQISILQGSTSGTAVYVETQTPTTNANGLVSLKIGSGTTSDDFSTIDWSDGPYFIKTETDPIGGANYTITGTSQLLSVPYALHAKTAGTNYTQAERDAITAYTGLVIYNITTNRPNYFNGTEWMNYDGTSAKTYIFPFTDARDGKVYNWVQIGDQVWMAENLAYLPSVVGADTGSDTTSYYYVYGYNGTNVSDAKATANYDTYGVLYNWTAAMNGEASSASNPSGIQGVCPTGWHLPSDAEWTELTDYLGRINVGDKLKSNETGFTALMGGIRSSIDNGTFDGIGGYGHWWSATERVAASAWYLGINYNGSYTYRDYHSKELGLSVRCVRD